MNTRKLVSAVAIASALALGTTGCSLTHNVQSLNVYTPSDGSQTAIGAVKFRNFIILSDSANGDSSYLIGSLVNSGDIDETVSITRLDGTLAQEIVVPAGTSISFGDQGVANALVITKGFTPGGLEDLYIKTDANSAAQSFGVPVLEGMPEQYAQFFNN